MVYTGRIPLVLSMVVSLYAADMIMTTTAGHSQNQQNIAATVQEKTPLQNYLEKTKVIDYKRLSKSQLVTFYEEREGKAFWTSSRIINNFIQVLNEAKYHGLNPEEYSLSLLQEKRTGDNAAFEKEILLTQSLFDYVDDIYFGRLDPKSMSIKWYYEDDKIKLSELVKNITTSGDLGENLKGLESKIPQYQKLKAYYQKFLDGDIKQVIYPPVPAGITLKSGMTNERVIALKNRLILEGFMPKQEDVTAEYDFYAVEAVKAFQEAKGIKVDGVVGSQTYSVLNRKPVNKVENIKTSLERLRWLPQTVPNNFIWVNIPAFKLDVIENDESVMDMKVIVGRVSRKTPNFLSNMTNLVFNPPWNVPYKIAVRDLLPKFDRDPGYAARNGYSVSYAEDFRIRQRPGPGNALGRIKFNMPNRHVVYLHDTSSRKLFNKAVRALSSGCVRVSQPNELAEYLLARDKGWGMEEVVDLIDRGLTKSVQLDESIPVYILYLTASIDNDGKIFYHEDIYQHDKVVASLQKKQDESLERIDTAKFQD